MLPKTQLSDGQRPRRDIACKRCRRLKRKCDHVEPTCGECRRTGSDCVKSRRMMLQDSGAVSSEYVEHLKSRIAELENEIRSSCPSIHTRDIGVQTESEEQIQDSTEYIFDPRNEPSPPFNRSLSVGIWEHCGTMPEQVADSLYLNTSCFADPGTGPGDIGINFRYESKLPGQIFRFGQYPRTSLPEYVQPFHISFNSSFRQGIDTHRNLTNESLPGLRKLYANIYFCHVQWPFLDEQRWKLWHEAYGSDESARSWECYFLDMVYAIGALFYSVLQGDPKHLTHSICFFDAAKMSYHLAISKPSMILRAQASLLMIIYALHSPFHRDIAAEISAAMFFCTSAVFNIPNQSSVVDIEVAENDSSSIVDEQTFIACYMLHEIIVSVWEQPVSASYKFLDDKMHRLSGQLPISVRDSAFNHLFSLRKVQASIRRRWEKIGNSSQLHNPINQDWVASTKSKLALWREAISLHGDQSGPFGYLRPLWMKKLYDYSVVMLMQEKRWYLSPEDIQLILEAVTEVCLSFRQVQEEGHIMCYTWPAVSEVLNPFLETMLIKDIKLVFQFRAGVMLLYAYWITPIALRSDRHWAQETQSAIFACARSISSFSTRWKDALVYRDTFELLMMQTVSWSTMTHRVYLPEQNVSASLKNCLQQLKNQHLNKTLLAVIEEMASESIA